MVCKASFIALDENVFGAQSSSFFSRLCRLYLQGIEAIDSSCWSLDRYSNKSLESLLKSI